ncbi:MAG: hypothetical protein ACM31C_05030 [Acidobacteriota bacterium]
MGFRRVWLGAALLSCGGSQHTTTSAPTPVSVKTYRPLGIRADAKAPRQAVILGTDANDGSTVLPLPAAQATGRVDAMFVSTGGGGLSPIELATAPDLDGGVQVATGPAWRAGVWGAAIVAASVLDKDVTDFTFSATSGGVSDGASASALIAAGFLATLTGAPIDPQATMTGILDPDGAIGPVDGLPEQLLGAIAQGKKKLGYPIGMRMARSEASGQPVDVEELAKAHGARAIAIADAHDAYRLLTGKQLPRAVPVAEADMALDAATTKLLEGKYLTWQQQVAQRWATIVQLDSAGRLPATLVAMRDHAKQLVDAAEKMHRQGRAAPAYVRILTAAVYTQATADTYELLAKVQAGDLAGAGAMLGKLAERGKAAAGVLDEIGQRQPSTLGGHLTMIAAFETALASWVSGVHAARTVAAAQDALKSVAFAHASKAELGAPAFADTLVAALAPAAVFSAAAGVGAEVAREELELEASRSVDYTCSIPDVRRVASSFQAAAAAGLDYLDALLVEPLAKRASLPVDDARQRLGSREPDYLVTWMASRLGSGEGLPHELQVKWGAQSLAWSLLSLAGSELAYDDAGLLISKHASLGVKTDDGGKLTGLAHDEALDPMLATAERSARASARAARIATGAIPVPAKLAYQAAMLERDGDLSAKLDALRQFRTASAMSQIAVMLARN